MMNLQSTLQLAFGDHQAGRLDAAAQGYQEILNQEPEHPDALNLLGVLCSQRKDYAKALAFLLKAIAVKPEFSDAWLNLAKTLSSTRRLHEAVGACDVVLRMNPKHAEALATQARTLRKLNQFDAALMSARAYLAVQADSLEMGRIEAACLVALKRYDEAGPCFEHWLAKSGNDETLSNDYAMLLVHLGRQQEAISRLEALVCLPKPFLPACSNLGNLLHDQGEHERALALHQTVVDSNPQLYAGWINYGNVLQKQGRLKDARQALEVAIRLKPDRSEAYVNLASILMAQGEEILAFDSLNKAIALAPDFVDAWNNLGAMELDCARPGNAQKAYAQAVARDPQLAAAQFGLALSYLMQGDFTRGWPLYEWRWLGASQAKPQEAPRFSCPQWTGQPTQPQVDSIVIYHEQGFGDTIQFARFLPQLQEKFVQITWVIQPELYELVAHNFPPQIQVLTSAQGQSVVRARVFDWHCPMGSLPFALGLKSGKLIPGISGYLKPMAGHSASQIFDDSVRQAKQKKKKVIGLCWAGNPGLAHNKTRSLKLSMLSELTQIPGVVWVSLQRERSLEDAQLLQSWGVIDMSESLNDFSDTAAVIQQLDLVISVDTVVVHLAGALGTPCWLLNRFQSEWRWMHGCQDSAWYASVKQWRQERKNDWLGVLSRVKEAVTEVVHGHHQSVKGLDEVTP